MNPAIDEKNRPPLSLKWVDLDSKRFVLLSTLYILAADVFLYPSDLITTRLQADKFTDQATVKTRNLIRAILKQDGFRGFYRGFNAAAIGSFPGQFLYYLSYEVANNALRETKPSSSASNQFLYELAINGAAGTIAEATSSVSYLPTDIVTQRMQTEPKYNFLPAKFHNNSAHKVIKHVWKTEGIKGFFRGFWPYMAVYGPGSAIWWAGYEASKLTLNRTADLIIPTRENHPFSIPNSLITLASGSMAGILSCLITNPLDVARTRIQLLEVGNDLERKDLKRGFRHILQDIIRREGVQGLYKGIRPRVYIRIPGSALTFLGYEILKESSKKEVI